MDSQETIRQAIQAIQNGDKETGRRLLAQVLRADPTNVEAWLWMSDVVNSDEKKRDCLRQVLALDPQNQAAKRKMTGLLGTAASQVATDLYTPDEPLSGLTPGFTTQRSRVVSESALSPAQRKRGHRNTMLAGAMLLSMTCGLALLIYMVTTIVPQARERMKPTPEAVLYTATLWCLPCEQADSQIVLWERVGDGVSRGNKTGELPHNTIVSILAEEWSEPEERVYYKVTAQDQKGWVPETFIKQ
jgi:hypothetical protein